MNPLNSEYLFWATVNKYCDRATHLPQVSSLSRYHRRELVWAAVVASIDLIKVTFSTVFFSSEFVQALKLQKRSISILYQAALCAIFRSSERIQSYMKRRFLERKQTREFTLTRLYPQKKTPLDSAVLSTAKGLVSGKKGPFALLYANYMFHYGFEVPDEPPCQNYCQALFAQRLALIQYIALCISLGITLENNYNDMGGVTYCELGQSKLKNLINLRNILEPTERLVKNNGCNDPLCKHVFYILKKEALTQEIFTLHPNFNPKKYLGHNPPLLSIKRSIKR